MSRQSLQAIDSIEIGLCVVYNILGFLWLLYRSQRLMRHDWTLLCSEVDAPSSGSITLKNVITAIRVADRFRVSPINTILSIDGPLWIVLQWTAEFNVDRLMHTGLLQLMTPGGEDVLDQRKLEFDFRHTTVYRFIHGIREMRFVGLGTYEFHVLVADFAERGEWGRATLKLV